GLGGAHDAETVTIVVDLVEDEADIPAPEGGIHVLYDPKVLLCGHRESPVWSGESARLRNTMTDGRPTNIGKIAYPLRVQQIVFEEEKRGCGARRHADFVVGVLVVVVHRAMGDPELRRDLLVRETTRHEAEHVDLSLGEPRGKRRAPLRRCAGRRLEHRVHR